jgi:hypothetical protein
MGVATGVRTRDGAKVPVCAARSLIQIEKRRTGIRWSVANAHKQSHCRALNGIIGDKAFTLDFTASLRTIGR